MTRDDFEPAYERLPPWDLGRPQPALRDLAERGGFDGRVLDVGCGTGEHALLAAERGHEAWGVDTAPTAIERARARADRRGLDAAFRVHDALALPELGERFDTALDVGLFHALDPATRAEYATALRSTLRPGGHLHVHCLSERDPHDAGPHRIERAAFEASFDDGWRVVSVEPAPLVWRWLPRPRRGFLATIRRT